MGARVIATAGGPKKTEVCRRLGADVAIDYKSEDFAVRVNEVTSDHGADVIVDTVGGDIFHRSTKCIAFEGRLLVIGFSSGAISEVRANHLLVKNYSVAGLYWGTYLSAKPDVIVAAQKEIDGLYLEGKVAPLVFECVPLVEAPAAMTRVTSGATYGRILLIP
jgi:NADPH2:quinone reductase